MKSSLILLGSILAVVFSSRANAQCTGSLVGTWRLLFKLQHDGRRNIRNMSFVVPSL